MKPASLLSLIRHRTGDGPRILAALFLAVGASAQETTDDETDLPRRHRVNGRATVLAARPAMEAADESTAAVWDGDRLLALATLVSADGILISKASELEGDLQIEFRGEDRRAARIVATDRSLDLALLQADTGTHPVAPWASSSEMDIGSWVFAPGGPRRDWIGVVSAPSRPIPSVGGALGVSLGRRGNPRRILEVYEGSAAAQAGLLGGDEILKVDGEPPSRDEGVPDLIGRHEPGETVTLRILRDETEMDIAVTLGYRAVFDRFDRNQRMSGASSRRRTGFERVLQHDTPIPTNNLGGPLVNLDGQVVGVNIARADRITTFALPVEVVLRSLKALRQTARDADSNPPEDTPSDNSVAVTPPGPEDLPPELPDSQPGDP